MKVCVVGLGYVGLPTALKLAECGHNVIGVDINKELLNMLQTGTFTSPESGMTELFHAVREQGTIQFQATPEVATAYIISVPTPIDSEHRPNLNAVIAAATAIRPYVQEDTLVVLESTVPPGTTAQLAAWIGELRAHYAHVPERVLPGNLLDELTNNECGNDGVQCSTAWNRCPFGE